MKKKIAEKIMHKINLQETREKIQRDREERLKYLREYARVHLPVYRAKYGPYRRPHLIN